MGQDHVSGGVSVLRWLLNRTRWKMFYGNLLKFGNKVNVGNKVQLGKEVMI